MIIDPSGIISFESGEALIYAAAFTRIQCGSQTVNLKPGTIAWLSRQGNSTRICSLAAQTPNAIEAVLKNKSIQASYGEELILGDQDVYTRMIGDNLGHRNIRVIALSENISVAKSEVSTTSVFNSSDLLQDIYISQDKQDKAMLNKIVKTAACISVVTGNHGPYGELTTDVMYGSQTSPGLNKPNK
jgi:hypothetical protein